MNVSVITTPNFEREAKKLIKKYRSLKSELQELASDLESNPKMGVLITDDVYKLRLSVKSKGKGKSGGVRIITYVEVELLEHKDCTEVYLLSIYDKSKQSNISDKFIANLVSEIRQSKEKLQEEE